MTYQANVYRVMLASPSDVKEERKEFPRVLDTWNALHSTHEKAVILPIKWETHSTPEMGGRPQAIINKQLVNESDILVGVFWTKLGTPTGKASSGSVEEIEEFLTQRKPVLLYFSNAPVVADSINVEQYQLLKGYRDRCFKEGLVATYDSIADFRELLLRHLLDTVRRLQGTAQPPELSSIVNSPRGGVSGKEAKVKVDVEHSITGGQAGRTQYKLVITLANSGKTTISNYRLDIEFPRTFLNPHTIYALEKTERSTDKYKFFRVTQENHRNVPLYPGDNRTVFITDYFIDEELHRSGAVDDHLKVKIYVDDNEVAVMDKPMRDLMIEDWQH